MSATRTPATSAIRSTLDAEAQQAVQQRLQPLLVDLIDLTLTSKQLHWNVVGPRFKDVHEHLDEIIDEYRMWSDSVAERLTSIGVAPDGRVQRVAGDSLADPAPESFLGQDEVVAAITDRIEAVARATRERLDGLGDADLVSEDLVIGILDGLEMQLWMWSAQQA
ncbi:MAG: DNA starvation/stationary phase protection protein [Nitriliruptoraceae bacterium]|nr:DNA starvation/stationary phase protection protein [Nitriliruptoraceae bacterium]